MGREIERKFLIERRLWPKPEQGVLMVQGYLTRQDGLTVRVRIAGDRGVLTLKGETVNISRSEFEYSIPVADAEALLEEFSVTALVRKVRYYCPYEGHLWEVDVFEGDNAGLIVAEIELKSEDEMFAPPPWISSEVSFDSRYRNGALAANPYRNWKNSVFL